MVELIDVGGRQVSSESWETARSVLRCLGIRGDVDRRDQMAVHLRIQSLKAWLGNGRHDEAIELAFREAKRLAGKSFRRGPLDAWCYCIDTKLPRRPVVSNYRVPRRVAPTDPVATAHVVQDRLREARVQLDGLLALVVELEARCGAIPDTADGGPKQEVA